MRLQAQIAAKAVALEIGEYLAYLRVAIAGSAMRLSCAASPTCSFTLSFMCM